MTRLIESSTLPLFAFDENWEISHFNEAFSTWIGITSEELQGQAIRYQSSPNPATPIQQLGCLCPPPSLVDSQSHKFTVTRTDTNTNESSHPAMIHPIVDDRGQRFWLIWIDHQTTESLGSQDPQLNEAQRLHLRLVELRTSKHSSSSLDQLLGESSSITRLREQIKIVHRERPRLMITAPTSTEAEELARSIHASGQADRVSHLIPVDCGLVDAELLQTTIIQSKKVHHEHISEAREAGDPTEYDSDWFLLLNVHALSSSAQHELKGMLELLNHELPTIAATTRTLDQLYEDENFDSELATRLSTMTIELPALRQRKRDLPLLIQDLIERFNLDGSKQVEGCTPEAMDRLIAYDWPGNYTELRSIVSSSFESAQEVLINEHDLPKRLGYSESAQRFAPQEVERIQLDSFLAEIETELIHRALRQCDGNKTKAAELLGISRARLHRKLNPEDEANDA